MCWPLDVRSASSSLGTEPALPSTRLMKVLGTAWEAVLAKKSQGDLESGARANPNLSWPDSGGKAGFALCLCPSARALQCLAQELSLLEVTLPNSRQSRVTPAL